MKDYYRNAIEFDVLQLILTEGSIRRAEALGVKDWHFTDSVAQEAFIQIKKHAQRKTTYGQTPSFKYMHRLCSDYPISHPCPEERLTELVGDLLSSSLNRELNETLEDASNLVNTLKQPTMALDYLAKKVRGMFRDSGKPDHEKMGLPLGLSTALGNYNKVKHGGGMLGPAWPWEPLNLMTQGHKNGNLNVMYAPTKHGKTWVFLDQK